MKAFTLNTNVIGVYTELNMEYYTDNHQCDQDIYTDQQCNRGIYTPLPC